MIRESVSAILIYQNKILTVIRQHHLDAFPGHFAFVAGKVEKEDREFETPLHQKFTDIRKEHLGALIREVREEIDVDLTKIEVKNISHFADAIAPDFNIHRFHSFFYRIDLGDEIKITPEVKEIFRAGWLTAAEAIDLFEQGKVVVVPPILKMFQYLNQDIAMRGPVDISYLSETTIPSVETVKGITAVFVPSNTLPPARFTNCYLIGDMAVDPSPKSEELRDQLIQIFKERGIKRLFLSHGHPDHYQYSSDIARTLKLPIFLSHYTENHIKRRSGEDYFKDITLNYLVGNERIGKWLDEDVIVETVPGHDEGQLALTTTQKSWYFVGDLIQGEGSVVIGAPEGDMAKYYKTLTHVITLKPRFMLPSHGIIVGGIELLKKVLNHRKNRENDILLLAQKGLDREEILKFLYKDIDPRLHRYALKNIDAHLQLLRASGKI